MAVEAVGSRHSKHNWYLIAVMCVVFGLWFGYDGWVSKSYQQTETDELGQPTANLQFNRYSPIGLVMIAAYAIWAAQQVSRRRIVADEKGLHLQNGMLIPYGDILQIDKRFFEKEGHFTITYNRQGATCKLKCSDRQYDNMGLLLDEIVRQTGAVPAADTEGASGVQDNQSHNNDNSSTSS